MTSTPRPDPGRTLTTPTPDLRQDPDMPKSTPEARMADQLAGRYGPPGHNHWARTCPVCDLGQPEARAGGFVPVGKAEGQPPVEARPEGYGYGMPPTRTESVAVTLGAENVRHAFTTTPEREPEGSRTAPQQLARFLSERAVGVSPRGEFRWAGTPRDHGYLTKAEVRTLTTLFVQLAQEMTEKHEHDWKTQPLISGGSREVCLKCGVSE